MNLSSFLLSKVDTSEEIYIVVKLASEIWREFYNHILSNEQIDYMLKKFQSFPAVSEQINLGYEYYLIYVSGVAIGYVGIKEEEGALFLSKLYILKEHRGKGYSSQTFTQLVEGICSRRKLGKIWLTVNKYNSSSIAIYKNKGFTIVRTQLVDIGNGYVMDDYIMEKLLN